MIDEIIATLGQAASNPANEQALLPFGKMLSEMPSEQTGDFLQQLIGFAQSNPENWVRPTTLLLGNLPNAKIQAWLPSSALPQICQLYEVCPSDQILRIQLLSMLAAQGSEAAIDSWCYLLCNEPPATAAGIEAAFHPIVSTEESAISQEQLLKLVTGGAGNPVIASAIYELANHQYRKGHLDNHPLAQRSEQLSDLLSSLVRRMALIEEGTLPDGVEPDSISHTVQNSVALIIALIDTLGLLKVESATGKFNQAFELRHRRIQVEAAAALAKLEEPTGKKKLLDLAAHPVVRPRVLAYAKELGFEKDVSLEHTGPIANAETQLALWLAQSEQMGLAPTEIELLDHRELFWPSYEDPMACYLFEFKYGTGENAYSNIGISGPLTHAFVPNITELPIADQYSAFAGWQTMSDEIYLVPIERAMSMLAGPTESLKQKFDSSKLDEFEIKFVAGFFGEYVLVVSGARKDVHGTLIIDDDGESWIPAGTGKPPIDENLAFDIWCGRKLLTNFNPAFS